MDVLFLKSIMPRIMNKEEMISGLKEIIKPYIQDEDAFANLSEETDFINDLKINSANLVDVVLDIEDKYDIIIDNDAMDSMLDVKSALAVIESKLTVK